MRCKLLGTWQRFQGFLWRRFKLHLHGRASFTIGVLVHAAASTPTTRNQWTAFAETLWCFTAISVIINLIYDDKRWRGLHTRFNGTISHVLFQGQVGRGRRDAAGRSQNLHVIDRARRDARSWLWMPEARDRYERVGMDMEMDYKLYCNLVKRCHSHSRN